MKFGDLSTRRWLAGQESATWSRVYGLRLSSDAAYASQPFDENNEAGVLYFPLGQEWQEVHVRRPEEGGISSFSLLSRESLLSPRVRERMETNDWVATAYTDASDPLALQVIDPDVLEDVRAAHPGFDFDPSKGAAFVSLDLTGIEVDYADLRLSLRDAWTGRSVAPFHFLPQPPGVKQARTLRGFFTDVPEGQFALVVVDKAGALKWIDVVRGRAGALQVVSVRE
jgi:hypothetical protein